MKTTLPCLPLLQERFWNIIKGTPIFERNHIAPSFNFTMFNQTWGSTALGFGGWGGSAMTDAYTTVIEEKTTNIYGVFFGERFAYYIENPNQVFFNDIKNHNMKLIYEISKYQ